MPVDRPSRHARGFRNIVERSVSDAALGKNPLRGVQYAVTRRSRFVARSSHPATPLQNCAVTALKHARYIVLLYLHTWLYVNFRESTPPVVPGNGNELPETSHA